MLHGNSLAYSTQVVIEVILGVAGKKLEHEAEIRAMVRETGHANITKEDIDALNPVDRATLEAALAEWKRKQEQVRSRNHAHTDTLRFFDRRVCTPSHDLCICIPFLSSDRGGF